MAEMFGRWIFKKGDNHGIAPICSVCNTEQKTMSKYCPECGADLRPEKVRAYIYDQEENYYNCRVQVLKNSITGECSWGYYTNGN